MKETGLILTTLLALSGPETRLFRNASSKVWFGRKVGETGAGGIILAPGAHMGWSGLIEGSSDIIGIHEGRFAAIEMKTPNVTRSQKQIDFVKMVNDLGGLAGFAKTVAEAQEVLRGERRS